MVGPLDTGRGAETRVDNARTGDESLSSTTLPSDNRDQFLSSRSDETLVASLPGEQLFQGIRDSAVSTYERTVDQVTRIRNETVNRVNDALQTPLGQAVLGTGRAIINTGGDVIDAVRNPGRTIEQVWNFTTDRARELPAAVEQLLTNPGQTLEDIRLGAQQTVNDAILYVAQNGFPGMPPSMREHGIVEISPQHGVVIRDPVTGVIADFGGDNELRVGFRGYRLPISPGVYSQPVPGSITTYNGRAAVSSDDGQFLYTNEGWRLRNSNGQYGEAYPDAVRASLTNPRDGSRTYGLVVQPDNASDGRVFLLPGDRFQVQNSEREGYSRTFDRSTHTVTILDGQVWVQERSQNGERTPLLNLGSDNVGSIRLPQADGTYGPPRQGQYVINNINNVEIPGVLRSDLDAAVIELPGQSYRVKLPGNILSEPIRGEVARLTDPATGEQGVGIVTVNENGDRVFAGTRGWQISPSGADRYSVAVPYGTPSYIESTTGNRELAIVLQGEAVHPALRGNAAATLNGYRVRDAQGNWSGELPGTPTVLNNQPVVEIELPNSTENYRIVTNGASVQVSDSTGRGWTDPRSGSVVQLSDGSLAIQPEGTDNVLVSAVIDGTEQYRLYDMERESWSQAYSGELDTVDGIPVVRSGNYIFNARNEYRDTREPNSTWRPYVPYTTGERLEQREEESLLERVQRGFSDGYASQVETWAIVGGPSEELTRLSIATQGIRDPEDIGDRLQNFSNDAGQLVSSFLHHPLIPYLGNLSRATIDPTLMGPRHVEGTYGTTAEDMRASGRFGLATEAVFDLLTFGLAPSGVGSQIDPTAALTRSAASSPAPRPPEMPTPQRVSNLSPEVSVNGRIEQVPTSAQPNNVVPLTLRDQQPHLVVRNGGLSPAEQPRLTAIDGGNTTPRQPSSSVRTDSGSVPQSQTSDAVRSITSAPSARSETPGQVVSPAAQASGTGSPTSLQTGRAELFPYDMGTAARVPDAAPLNNRATPVVELRPPPPPQEVTLPSRTAGDSATLGIERSQSPSTPLPIGDEVAQRAPLRTVPLPTVNPNDPYGRREYQEYLQETQRNGSTGETAIPLTAPSIVAEQAPPASTSSRTESDSTQGAEERDTGENEPRSSPPSADSRIPVVDEAHSPGSSPIATAEIASGTPSDSQELTTATTARDAPVFSRELQRIINKPDSRFVPADGVALAQAYPQYAENPEAQSQI